MIPTECNICGCIFDYAHDIRCPACRALRLEKAFKPRDPERTLQAMEMTNLDSPEVIVKLWENLSWEKAQTEGLSEKEYLWGLRFTMTGHD